MSKLKLVGYAALLTTFVAGATSAYFCGRYRATKEYEEELTSASEALIEMASLLAQAEVALEEALMTTKTGPFSTPQSAMETLHPEDEGAEGYRKAQLAEVEKVRQRRAKQLPKRSPKPRSGQEAEQVGYRKMDFDNLSLEEKNKLKAEAEALLEPYRGQTVVLRGDYVPEVITHAEFLELEQEGYTSAEYTYYVGDSTLVDEADSSVIDDTRRFVGVDFEVSFGTNGDPNVVYVKNDILKLVIEITKSDGSYSVEVLGETPNQGV